LVQKALEKVFQETSSSRMSDGSTPASTAMRFMHSASVMLARFSTIDPLITKKCPAHAHTTAHASPHTHHRTRTRKGA
jgi:hypothetical protein